MRSLRQAFYYSRVLADLVILVASYFITYILIPSSVVYKTSGNASIHLISLGVLWLFTTKSTGLYDEFRSRNFSYELIAVLKNVFAQGIGVVVIVFLMKENEIPRRFIAIYPSLIFILLTAEKFSFRRILNRIRRKGRNVRSLLIIGAGSIGKKFHSEVITNPHFGYRFIGFLDDKPQPQMNGEYLGMISELENILETKHVDEVIVALPNKASSRINDVINICDKYAPRVRIIPDYFQFISEKYSVSMFGSFPVIAVREDKINELFWRMMKRIFDTLFSLIVILGIFTWLFPLLSALIKLTSSGPIFYKQERSGRGNRKFITYKFRSMVVTSKDVDHNGKFLQTSKDDPRITRLGKFLRMTNLDELPQFFNVLRGDMSIVGPRPHPVLLNIESRRYVENYMQRHRVKPGITGWAQVNGYRGETKEPNLMKKRVEYDIWYIENWSFWFDLQIIFLTVWLMIKGDPHAY